MQQSHVVNMFREKKWSLDVCVGRALLTGAFRRDEIVCTKTLYNYVTKSLLKPIKSIDLPERTRRKQRPAALQYKQASMGIALMIVIRML